MAQRLFCCVSARLVQASIAGTALGRGMQSVVFVVVAVVPDGVLSAFACVGPQHVHLAGTASYRPPREDLASESEDEEFLAQLRADMAGTKEDETLTERHFDAPVCSGEGCNQSCKAKKRSRAAAVI